MPNLNKIYLYRMTHIMNIPHILNHGITHISSPNSNPDFVSIGDSSLINTRNEFILNNGRKLGDYIPFYFGARMPMLYVIQRGYNLVSPTRSENIVYIVSSVQKMIELNLDFVFTDGHAVDKFSVQYTQADIENIEDLIDRKAISARYWNDENDLDLKRRKEAEFLVLGDISITAVLGYIIYNEAAKDRMLNFGVKEEMIIIKPEYYF